MTTQDPDYLTSGIKYKLKRKNRLVRTGMTEEAGSIANRNGKDILRHTKIHLNKIAKDMWAAVWQ